MSLPPLRPYQAEGVRWLRASGRALLADEPGLGKTRQLIEASEGRTLVIAPAMVLDGGTWSDEIAKWASDPDRFTCVPYSMLNSRERTGNGSGTKPAFRLRPEYDQRYDTIILDEAHYIKGRKSYWTWAVQELAARADLVYAATGTPIPNWAYEMFTLLQVLYPEDARKGGRFGSYWRWVEQWFSVYADRYSQFNIGSLRRCLPECAEQDPNNPCGHYHTFVRENLGSRFLQRLRDDVLPDLPPLEQQSISVTMGSKQKSEYRSMKKDYLATVDGSRVVAWSSSARHVKMDRLTTGLDLLDVDIARGKIESGYDFARADNAKLDRLRWDLASRARPTLVMAHYQDTVEAAVQVARVGGVDAGFVHGGTSKKDRARRVAAFKRGDLPVLVGSLETLAEGLTLTAADMLIFVEKSFKPSRNEQAMRRVHRLGQTRPVTVLDYVTIDSVDSRKRELLEIKSDHQMRTLTAARMGKLL